MQESGEKLGYDDVEIGSFVATLNRLMKNMGGAVRRLCFEGVTALELSIGRLDFSRIDAEKLRTTLIQTEIKLVADITHERVMHHFRRLHSAGMITMADDASATGLVDKRIPPEHKQAFLDLLDYRGELDVPEDSHGDINDLGGPVLAENVLLQKTKQQIIDLVMSLRSFIASSSPVPERKNTYVYNHSPDSVGVELETLRQKIDQLSALINEYLDNPYQYIADYLIDDDGTFVGRVTYEIDEIVYATLGQKYEELEAEKVVNRKRSKIGKVALKNYEDADEFVEELDGGGTKAINQVRDNIINLEYSVEQVEVPDYISIWTHNTSPAKLQKVAYGDSTVYVAHDYDPRLEKIAKTTRKKHPTPKGKDHPYDRLATLVARSIATSGSETIHDVSFGRKISPMVRSNDYVGLDVWYARSKANNSSRVYYMLRPMSELTDCEAFGINGEEICVVIIAETDKANEDHVIKRIRGQDARSARRGM